MGLVYGVIWWLTALLFPLFFWPKRVGREAIPRRGGALLCANHQSWLDILLIGSSVRRPVRFVARDTLGRSRLLGFIMRRCGSILIQRGAPDKTALRSIEAALRSGELVAIFPEGTRTFDGSVGEFRGGALLAARRAGVPLIPAGIRGSFQAWPRGQRLPRPRRLGIAFGPAVGPEQADLERLRRRVAELAGEPLSIARAGSGVAVPDEAPH
jgi:1-acyl-sn-glycerol-3-phosphate acyltransferase